MVCIAKMFGYVPVSYTEYFDTDIVPFHLRMVHIVELCVKFLVNGMNYTVILDMCLQDLTLNRVGSHNYK